jgi:hypothetical protein
VFGPACTCVTCHSVLIKILVVPSLQGAVKRADDTHEFCASLLGYDPRSSANSSCFSMIRPVVHPLLSVGEFLNHRSSIAGCSHSFRLGTIALYTIFNTFRSLQYLPHIPMLLSLWPRSPHPTGRMSILGSKIECPFS